MPDNKQHQDQSRQNDQIDNQQGRQVNQPNRNDMDQDRQTGQQTKQGGKSDKMEEPNKNRDNR